jgi:histidinol phosphatase-like enzyme
MHCSPFAPLPGTEPRTRAIFVDRWGTLLSRPAPAGDVAFDATWLVPGSVDALFRAQQHHWQVYLIGNEDAVAQGRMSDACWERFEVDLLQHLRGRGVSVVRNYACLDHPDGRGRHRRPSVFLLPDTGLLYHAAQADGVVLRESWVIGDSTLELAAGGRAGCRTLGVRTGMACRDGSLEVEPELDAENLTEAVQFLADAVLRV